MINKRQSETIAGIVSEMLEFAETDSQTIGRDVLRRRIQKFAKRIEAAHQREVAELKHWIKSAARWIKCHDIYHTSGGDLIKQAKEILSDDGEFLFKKGEQ